MVVLMLAAAPASATHQHAVFEDNFDFWLPGPQQYLRLEVYSEFAGTRQWWQYDAGSAVVASGVVSVPAGYSWHDISVPATLAPGSYTADAEDVHSLTYGPQAFTVYENESPVVTQLTPAAGTSWAGAAPQVFTYSVTNELDQSFSARLEIERSALGAWTPFDSSPTGPQSPGSNSASPSKHLTQGSYRWRLVDVCDVGGSTACATTPFIEFSVQPSAPGTPTQASPANNAAFGANDPQVFSVTATDADGDAYRGKVTVTPSSGPPVVFDLSVAPSGQQSTGTPPNKLGSGTYTWTAVACEAATPNVCGSASGSRTFTVSGVAGNAAPSAPEVIAPQANSTFDAGERQDFAIRATDPDRDTYTGRIEFFHAVTGDKQEQEVNTSPAPSGAASVGTLGTNGLAPGTWRMRARVFDSNGAESPSTEQFFAVASAAVNPCQSSSTPVVDGWFGDRYLRIATATVGDVGYVCVRTTQGLVHQEGWLRAEVGGAGSGGGPSTSTSIACPDEGDGVIPLVDFGTGDEPQPNNLWARLRTSGASVTACFRVRAAGGNLLDTAVTMTAPEGAEFSDLNFIPEGAPWTPPVPVAPTAGLPSSECYAAAGNALIVNAQVDGQHTWLYRQQDPTVSRVCARIQGADDGGVVVRVPSSGGGAAPYTLTTGRPAFDAGSPCTVTELSGTAPVVFRLRRTEATADPVGVCLYTGIGSSDGVSAWLTLDRSPDAPVPTVQSDP